MSNPRLFTFLGGQQGRWRVRSLTAIQGETLPEVSHLEILAGDLPSPTDGTLWTLRGVTSNERYVTRPEKEALVAKQAALGRPEATYSALIPIRKSPGWWALTQDERRAIFEEQSRHLTIGLKYLPQVARRLHHCRDLGASEPFDFLTLFDYAPEVEGEFDQMLVELRATEEWRYVDWEVDIRLERIAE